MYLPARSLDDLLRRVFEHLLRSRNRVRATRGESAELTGVLLKIADPRARLSRTETKGTLFSCLGEVLWYLAGTKNTAFITHYIPKYRDESVDGRTIYGGYGPRLFSKNGTIDQVANVLALLKTKPSSRRAVIQLFDAEDIVQGDRREVPCTCTLQFMIRNRKLHMLANMRSNDAYLGLPHDVFAFTMIQELLARTLGIELGPYRHAVGCLHLYNRHVAGARRYLDEGWQESIAMPPMPIGDPWPALRVLLKAESSIRRGRGMAAFEDKLDGYWGDLARLLQIHWHGLHDEREAIAGIKRRMRSAVFNAYIQKRQRKKTASSIPEQLPLEFPVASRSES